MGWNCWTDATVFPVFLFDTFFIYTKVRENLCSFWEVPIWAVMVWLTARSIFSSDKRLFKKLLLWNQPWQEPLPDRSLFCLIIPSSGWSQPGFILWTCWWTREPRLASTTHAGVVLASCLISLSEENLSVSTAKAHLHSTPNLHDGQSSGRDQTLWLRLNLDTCAHIFCSVVDTSASQTPFKRPRFPF